MTYPTDFPSDVVAKLKIVDQGTQKNQDATEALKKQISADDIRKAINLVGAETPKDTIRSTMSTTAGAGATNTTTETTFWGKYKTYIIIGGVLVTLGIIYFVIKKKK